MPRNRLFGAGLLALALIVALVRAPSAAGPESGQKKAPIPSEADQARARTLIQELYGEEYAKARKDPVALASLARALLQEGRDTTDDPAGRYVLFREARDLAAQGGDPATALQAVDET